MGVTFKNTNDFDRMASVVRHGERVFFGGSTSGEHRNVVGDESLVDTASSTYAGPFTVTKNTTTATTADIAAGRIQAGISGGADFTATTKTGITTSCFLNIILTYTPGTGLYSVSLDTTSSFPLQSSTTYKVPLAYITCADSVISTITQYQYGAIFVAGRVV